MQNGRPNTYCSKVISSLRMTISFLIQPLKLGPCWSPWPLTDQHCPAAIAAVWWFSLDVTGTSKIQPLHTRVGIPNHALLLSYLYQRNSSVVTRICSHYKQGDRQSLQPFIRAWMNLITLTIISSFQSTKFGFSNWHWRQWARPSLKIKCRSQSGLVPDDDGPDLKISACSQL
jgi:hypothetical protein